MQGPTWHFDDFEIDALMQNFGSAMLLALLLDVAAEEYTFDYDAEIGNVNPKIQDI